MQFIHWFISNTEYHSKIAGFMPQYDVKNVYAKSIIKYN